MQVTDVPEPHSTRPDWAALYLKHREAMYHVAYKVLGEVGMADQAGDVVNEAMVSLMDAPPRDVRNWQALLVSTAKRRALDLLRSAPVRRAGPELDDQHDTAELGDVAEDAAERVDRQRAAARVWESLAVLDEPHRKVAREYIAQARPRADVAADLGVTPARVSQMMTRALKELRSAISREQVTTHVGK
ncbi:sigma-70 family RNA polymerase sigma factor [Nocardia niwae]|uniref:sigma-70 family RNA polymerase sigma factor n=1 Tax=Nocardia niwae TaxID=626084 RepID=UPI0033FCA98E